MHNYFNKKTKVGAKHKSTKLLVTLDFKTSAEEFLSCREKRSGDILAKQVCKFVLHMIDQSWSNSWGSAAPFFLLR